MNVQDVSSEVVVSRATTIATIILNAAENSLGALRNCSAALVTMINEYSSLCASDGSIDVVLQAISTIISYGKSLPISLSRLLYQSMDKLTLARGTQLVPGEVSSVVVDKIRFLSSSGFLSHVESVTYESPRTTLEKFLGTPSVTMTFRHDKISLTRTVSFFGTRGNLVPAVGKYATLSDSSDSSEGGDGAVVQVSVSQSTVNYLPGRSPNTTATKVILSYDSDPGVSTVIVTIPNLIPIPYDDIKPQNGSVLCNKRGYPYSVSANCSFDPSLNITCPGNATRKVEIVCPVKKYVPVCLAWNGEDYVASNACTVLSYTADNTTCACIGYTGYDESLGEPATNNPQIDNIAASADIEVTGFSSTWESAEDVSSNSLTRNKVSRRNVTATNLSMV